MTIAVLGEALIDFIVGEDGAYLAHLGGSPYNVAIGLARQGASVCYLSPFSDDTFGDRLHDALQKEGVQLPVTRRSRLPTSLALVAVDDQGFPAYRLYRDGVADKDIDFEEIESHLPKDLQLFHTGSLAITPSQLPKIIRLFKLMRSNDIAVSIDINIRLHATNDTTAYLDGVRSLLPLADIVKASDDDLAPFRFAPDARSAAKIAHKEMGSGLLVLTEGQGGGVLYTSDGTIEKSAYPVSQVVDTVGAGDTFHAAFLAALCRANTVGGSYQALDNTTLGDALDFANAAAAINVSRAGCNPPTQAEVEAFVQSVRR